MKTTITTQLVAATVALIVMLSATAHAIKVHQDLNMQDANLINAGGNNITNVAPGVEDMDAVNVSQLTNATGNTMAELNALSNYIQGTMITGVANYAYLTGQVNDTYVNVDGDTMTGPLTINNNLTVNGKINAADIYALTQTVLNITISNQCIIATNLQVQGIIDGVVGTNIPSSAVNYAQLTNALANAGIDIAGATNALWQTTVVYIDGATNAIGVVWDGRWVNVTGDNMTGILGMGGNRITNMAPGIANNDAATLGQLNAAVAGATNVVSLQHAYNTGNTIATTAGKGDVAISGTQKLAVSAAGGVEVSGGNVNVTGANAVQVDGPSGGQVRVNGANESVRVNGAGKMEIWSGGSVALEFE